MSEQIKERDVQEVPLHVAVCVETVSARVWQLTAEADTINTLQ